MVNQHHNGRVGLLMSNKSRDLLWTEALVVMARMDHLPRETFRPTAVGWDPAVDVLDTEAGLLVIVALPGVRSDETEIGIRDGELLVRGIRRWPAMQHAARVHRIELPHGLFERRLPLPHGTYQLVGQDHLDGCLHLTLRRLG